MTVALLSRTFVSRKVKLMSVFVELYVSCNYLALFHHLALWNNLFYLHVQTYNKIAWCLSYPFVIRWRCYRYPWHIQ